MRAHNIKIPERAPTGAMRPLAKRNCCQIGPFNAYLPERASTAVQLSKQAPSKEKFLPKRALRDIYLKERAPTEAVSVNTAHSKKKLLLKRAFSNIHLPERAQNGSFQKKLLPLRALSDIYLTERVPNEAVDVKTTHSKRNCCSSGPSAASICRSGPLQSFQMKLLP